MMIHYTGTYTDQYELTMAQAYFQKGRKKKKAVFDYFFRKLPFEGGYAIFAGLEDLVDTLLTLRFDKRDLDFLHHPSIRNKSFVMDHFEKEPILHKVIENGNRLDKPKPLHDIAEYCRNRLDKLPAEYMRFINPHIYKTGLSDKLKKERDRLIDKIKRRISKV